MSRSSEKRVACVLISSTVTDEQMHALAEACLRLSPQVAIRPGEAVFLEVGSCRNLYTEESLRARLTALAYRLVGKGVRIAIEKDAPLALARARYPFSLEGMPLRALLDFADPFALESSIDDGALLRKVERTITILSELGIRTIAEFIALPSESLVSRLGREAMDLHARARGEWHPAWPGFHLPEMISERSEMGGENLEALLFVMRGILDRVTARLRGRAQRACKLEITFLMERWSTVGGASEGASRFERRFEIAFSIPQGALAGMLGVIRERIAHRLEREPLESPVEGVVIEVVDTVPGRGAQRDFFSRREEQEEILESWLMRLTHRLGKARAFLARPLERYFPEHAVARELEPPGPVAPVVPLRPSRLLPEPEPLDFQRMRVAGFDGPERITPEWWEEDSEESARTSRDYYRVTLEDGSMLWIFRQPGTRQYYLHGLFD